MLYAVIAVCALILILVILILVYRNKFQFCVIKIDEAQEDIEAYLENKKELLEKTIPIIKKELKKKDFLEEVPYCLDKGYDDFELHNFLKTAYNELFKTIDDNEKLLKSDKLLKTIDELNENEEDIIGAIKFYNDTVVDYNKLVSSFPSSLVALICRYKKEEFYNNEKREIFEILNER